MNGLLPGSDVPRTIFVKTVWILGDQLLARNAALLNVEKDAAVLMIESKARGTRIRYHKKKLVLVYSAMRHFAADLREAGWKVDYHLLGETPNFQKAIDLHISKYRPERIVITEPNDWPMQQTLSNLKLSVPIQFIPTNQFLVGREEFKQWAGRSARLLMEAHYRRIRKKTGYLMRENEPEGGQWNYDYANRSTLRDWQRNGKPRSEKNPRHQPDQATNEVMKLIEKEFEGNPGSTNGFWLPVNRAEALTWLQDFITNRLPHFGAYEDLMVSGEPVLYHSVLSPLLNLGLLSPTECVEAAIEAYRKGKAPLNSVEGFLRQIIGWREFINGIYWTRMPGYKELNYLEADLPLPSWFYTAKTEMNCLHQVLKQVIDLGYNHHIQRLMVLGNFFLLSGIRPTEVERWYLEMYVDAYDWVMAANVYGMVLFADGGYMATKPYAASSTYINKMSSYCEGCRYKPEVKTGPDACPYNYLYWNFYAKHQEKFRTNPRVRMMINTWLKKTESEKGAILRNASDFLEKLGR
ncbi:MAG: cryptochrome/photolyase family protein [Verrucomicrobia bacterium]|nr:cryptochrome/photolyase family protein [Verrucomicrobiota bacterium]